jgi:beta-glucosidase
MLGKFSRRDFAKLAGFSAVGMATTPARWEKGEAKPGHDTPAVASFKTTVFAGLAHRFLWHLKELGQGPTNSMRRLSSSRLNKNYTIGSIRE